MNKGKFRNLEALKCHFQHSGHQITRKHVWKLLCLHGHPMLNKCKKNHSSIAFLNTGQTILRTKRERCICSVQLHFYFSIHLSLFCSWVLGKRKILDCLPTHQKGGKNRDKINQLQLTTQT